MMHLTAFRLPGFACPDARLARGATPPRTPAFRFQTSREIPMRALIAATGLAAAVILFAGAAGAQTGDNEAGVPLTPTEAAGAWTVAAEGQDLCTLTLSAAHGVKAPFSCRDALAGNPTGWQATKDGMELVGANGQPMLAFHRWSNSLFVSHRSSGVDLQLRRGT
jgi:hypothetical protein